MRSGSEPSGSETEPSLSGIEEKTTLKKSTPEPVVVLQNQADSNEKRNAVLPNLLLAF